MADSDLTNQEKLEEVYKLTLENNHLLHKIQNRGRLAIIFRIIYWLAILGALGGAYYYVNHFFDSIQANNSKAEGVIQQFEKIRSQFPEAQAFQQFFDQLKPSNDTATTTE
jgi:hypothetical protein